MLNKITYISFFLSIVYCINLSIDQYFGTISVDQKDYNTPFLGGFNKPKIQWLDWDNDGLDDLFLLDEDGHIKYYNLYYCNNNQLCVDL